MSNLKTVAYLTPGHEFWQIFPDGEVPVDSFVPKYFGSGLESCLLIDGLILEDWQVKALAEHVMRIRPNLFSDSKDAEMSVRQGVPIPSRHFDGGFSEDPHVLFALIEARLEKSEDVDDPYNYWGSDE
jgi:hypothetical protein